MAQPAKAGLVRKVLKIAGVVLGCLMGFMLIATILLLTVLEPYAARYLKKQVEEKTGGLYTLAFDAIQINLLTTTVTLRNVHFYPDSATHRRQQESGKAGRSLFEVETPQVEIANINLIEALFNNRISIGTVFVDRPEITQALAESGQKDADAGRKGNKAIPGFMESLRIGEINIPDATYRYLVLGEQKIPQHEVPHVSFLVKELRLDSLGREDYTPMFQVDDIQVRVRNYAYHSPDSVYAIQVGLFTYSSRQAELVAEAVVIRANHQANLALPPDKANRSTYDLMAPRLQITGLDVAAAYRTKQLRTDQILLENPALDILVNTAIPATAESPELTDLYENVSPYLKEIGVKELRITGGNLTFRNKRQGITIFHEIERTYITLQAVQIDSSTLFTPKDNFFAGQILISTASYTYQHPHSPHAIKVGSMEWSTRGNYVRADSLRILGDWNKNDRLKQIDKALHTVYNLDVPRLRLRNVDLIQAFQTSRLAIGSIEVEHPVLDVLLDQNVAAADSKAEVQNTYRAVSDFVTELGIGEIRVKDASFTQQVRKRNVSRVQNLEHASLVATGLKLDSAFIYHSEQQLPLEEVVVTAHDYTYWMPDNTYTFTLNSLRYSTREQELTARSIGILSDSQAHNRRKRIDNNARRSLYDVSASQFRVTGLDVIKAMRTGRLEVDQVTLRHPDLGILVDRNIPATPSGQNQQPAGHDLFSIVNPVTVNTLRLENGTLTYREKREEIIHTHVLEQASAIVIGLNLAPAKLFNLENALPMQDMILTASDYTYRSPSGIYTLALDSLHYSSRQQELIARSIVVDADKEVNECLTLQNRDKAARNLFDISAARFRITGLDLIQVYETGQFTMTEMLFTEPEVTILQDQNVPVRGQNAEKGKDSANENKAMEQVAGLLEIFRVQNLRINDGAFTFNILQDTIRTSHKVAHVSADIDQLRLISLEATEPLNMFDMDDISVLVRDYSYRLPDSLYTFEVGEIRTSLRDPSLYIDSLRLLPLYTKEEHAGRLQYAQDRFEITVPGIELQGVNLRALFNNQDIIVARAHINHPVVDIYRDNRVAQDPNRRPLTLQRMLRQAEFYIKADTIALEGGKVTYSEIAPNGVEPAVLTLDDTIMDLINITNDSALISQNKFATVHASTQLMGESNLNVHFSLHLDHPEDLYTYAGTLEPMDFAAFNPLFEKLLFVRIESGHINKVEFSVKATEAIAEGQMRFSYDDLKIQLLNKEDPDNPDFLLKVGSWLVNHLVIKSNNPAGSGSLREGDIKVDRNYHRSVFNHISKAMMDGIVSSLMPPLMKRLVDTFR